MSNLCETQRSLYAIIQNINDPNANLGDLLIEDKGLDMYRDVTHVIHAVAPYQLLRYSCPPKEGQPLPLFLVSSITAFSVHSPSNYSSFIAPSNNALSAYLITPTLSMLAVSRMRRVLASRHRLLFFRGLGLQMGHCDYLVGTGSVFCFGRWVIMRKLW